MRARAVRGWRLEAGSWRQLFLALICCLALAAGEATTPATATPEGYRLFPGDRFVISVYGHPDLEVEAHVPASGELAFPLIGALTSVVGQRPEDLAAEVTRRLADGYIRNPSVTVLIREYGARTAWVVGAVKTPGPVKLDPLRPFTAQQAISQAGGSEEDADLSAMQVVRDDPQHAGAKLAIPLPARDDAARDISLSHGDLVVVPRADRVFVLGQVNYPRAIPLPARESLTVSKALSIAGGFARFARDGKVQLLRKGAQPVVVDVRALLDGRDGAVDPELKAGDTLFVPESRF